MTQNNCLEVAYNRIATLQQVRKVQKQGKKDITNIIKGIRDFIKLNTTLCEN